MVSISIHASPFLLPVMALACAPPATAPAPNGDATGADGYGDNATPADGSLPTDSPPAGDPQATTDFASPGPWGVNKTSGTFSVNDCVLAYDLYTPQGGPNAPLVLLGHGFTRDRSRMAGLAGHIASFGARVAAPSYCHSSLADADHEQNGRDAAALAAHLGAGAATVQIGYSAGGASACVAAANDPAAVGVMGLDAVDSGTLAQDTAAGLDLPIFGLAGKSSNCNASNNGLPIYANAADGWVYQVVNGGHCDFEDPTDLGCTLLCGSANAERQGLVRALTAAFVAWITGLDPNGAAWVQRGGAPLEALIAAGHLIAL